MARRVYVWRNGKFIELDLTAPRPERKTPYVITDSMPATVHPCDGRMYDSKSSFRTTTRAHGCTEVGNDNIESPAQDFGSVEEVAKDVAEVWNGLGYKNE